MDNSYLQHFGKKGMRWGNRAPVILGSAKSISDHGRSGVDAIRSTSANVHRSKKGGMAREEAHKMSDAELKQKIARMNLEQQYSSLSASSVTKGRVTAENSMAILGGALATASSVLGIALAVKNLRG